MLAGYCLDLLQLSSEWVLNTRELRNPDNWKVLWSYMFVFGKKEHLSIAKDG